MGGGAMVEAAVPGRWERGRIVTRRSPSRNPPAPRRGRTLAVCSSATLLADAPSLLGNAIALPRSELRPDLPVV